MTTGNGFATAEQLLGKKDIRYKTVVIDEARYRIRSLTAREMRRFRDSLFDGNSKPIESRMSRVPELLICQCLVDSEGKNILNEDHIDEFESVDSKVVFALGAACTDHTGWQIDYDIERVEEVVGNSA